MYLRDIWFGPVINASGARGFFGEGYWYHRFAPGLTYNGVTFVAKTTTNAPRLRPDLKQGNMPMRPDGITPRELFPACIKMYPFRGLVLNSVGLSGRGAQALMNDGRWQQRTEPFFLSWMSVAPTAEERFKEFMAFRLLLTRELPSFQAKVGLKINWSCPNAGLDPSHLYDEVRDVCRAANELGIPIVHKFNALIPPEVAVEISRYDGCDAVCVSNTIPFGEQVGWAKLLPGGEIDQSLIIPWRLYFKDKVSPLAHLGGGGLSGKPLLLIVEAWVKEARRCGLTKPIIAGGGILGPDDIVRLRNVGASAFSLGSISMLRPWRMKATITEAYSPYQDWDVE